MSNFQIGDEVFHKSNSSIKWVIERISDNEVHCSTLIKGTLEYKREAFPITSIEKCAKPGIIVGKRKRNNFW